MSEEGMIKEFLKNKEITKCPEDDKFTNENLYLKSKSHRTAYDYKLVPIWDNLEVFDNELNDHVSFSVRSIKTSKEHRKSGIKLGATITYHSSLRNIVIRENTITERISSGRYKITKKQK